MAPDAGGPSVKPAPIAGRFESSHPRPISPLPAKITSNTITSALSQARTTPQKKQANFHPDRDSDSSLSDYEGGDSDAETERLHISPQKQRPGMMVQLTGGSTITSKAPPMAVDIPAENPPKPSSEMADEHKAGSAPGTPTRSPSKKRKRDETTPTPRLVPTEDAEGKPVVLPPPKKKVLAAGNLEDTGAVKDMTDSSNSQEHPTANEAHSPKRAAVTNGTETLEESNNAEGTNSLMHADQNRDGDAEDEDADPPPSVPPEDEAADSVDANREDDEDAEREAKKQKAIEELAEIEKIFAKLKDSIYNDKLHRVEIEMKMLADGTHPEYVAQKKVIDERLEKKVRLADAQYKHAMESLQISTNVSRAQIHSQYFQTARELRENALQHCSELWYAIQRERRTADALVHEFSFKIPTKHSIRIKHRMQYNWEVQILGGIQRHIGFPAAPDVNGATEEEVAHDLDVLRIPRAVVGRSVAPPNVMRVDDHAQHNYSPPTPAVHSAAQQQQAHPHASQNRRHHHLGAHHHHHHHPASQQGPQRPHQQEQATYPPPPPRRPGSNLGPPPPSSSASLSSLLHPQQEGGVKMEGQQSQQTSLPAFSTFTPHLMQQQRSSPFSPSHSMHPFARTTNDSQLTPLGRRSPTPGERMISREHELETLKREAPDRLGSIGGAGLRGPLYRPGGGGLSYP